MRTPEEEANLRLARRVYDDVLGPLKTDSIDEIFTPDYIQHNPNIPSGREALRAMIERAQVRVPDAKHHVKRMMVDGDLVTAHVHVVFTPGERGLAVVDIFRIENGRVAEHWDVAQPIPETANNENGMF